MRIGGFEKFLVCTVDFLCQIITRSYVISDIDVCSHTGSGQDNYDNGGSDSGGIRERSLFIIEIDRLID